MDSSKSSRRQRDISKQKIHLKADNERSLALLWHAVVEGVPNRRLREVTQVRQASDHCCKRLAAGVRPKLFDVLQQNRRPFSLQNSFDVKEKNRDPRVSENPAL